MKRRLVVLGLIVMFFCIPFFVVADLNFPDIRLPPDPITMNAVDGQESYFDLRLSDVPTGFDVTDGVYPGWCVQKSIHMIRNVNHTVRLFSSYDPDLPIEYHKDDWMKINYILNHKQGTRDSIQNAIWYYTNAENCSADLNASAMIAAAESFGAGFIPRPGQSLAVPVVGNTSIQLTFIEVILPLPQIIEGRVWKDINRDGVQDIKEPGMKQVIIHLYDNNSSLFQHTTTTTSGYYQFLDVPRGSYYIQVIVPAGYLFSPENRGIDETRDSDVNTTGTTPLFNVSINISTLRWDAGLYSTPIQPRRPRNLRPSADGAAGEPYQGFVNESLIFNGSRSSDKNGKIISWEWDFGDGTITAGEVVFHMYDHAGDYPVTLTVKDKWFAVDVYTTTAHIRESNTAPLQPDIFGAISGHANTSYHYSITTIDPENNPLRYDITWGDNTQNTYQLYASGYQLTIDHTWTHYGFYHLNVSAQDIYGATSETNQITVAIDVISVGDLGYLIDRNSDGIFDVYQSNTTTVHTLVRFHDDTEYIIDTDGDNTFDMVYNVVTHQHTAYFSIPFLEYLILLIGISLIIVIFVFLKIKRQTRTLRSTRKQGK